MAEQQVNEVILLVGGNPLPNYIAACALKNEFGIENAFLLYTQEVEQVKDNLRNCLLAAGFTACRESFIADAGDPREIQYACQDIDPASHLHYTGGTNAMAVHVHAAWTGMGGTPDQASYLFGRDDRLMTDAGRVIDIASIHLDLPTLHNLHGPRPAPAGPMIGPNLPDDAEKIAQHVFDTPASARVLFNRFIRNHGRRVTVRQLRNDPPFCPPAELGLALSETRIPGLGWKDNAVKGWQKFLGGEWLDRWVFEKIKETGLINPPGNLHIDVKRTIQGREFQLDVVAIRGHHLYVVSCTTSQSLDTCKSKLFEVATRARQLGGDLARSALVCLAYEDEEQTDLVDELGKDVRSWSESSRVPQVFGLDHVREWAGHGSAAPNLHSLEEWLNS